MPAAAIVAVGALSAYTSSQAAKSAASKQANAADNAASAQLAQFNTINSQQEPYRNAGYGALSQLQNYMGIIPSAPQQTEDMFDSAAYLKDNPDIANSGMTPWEHYTKYGVAEGRQFTGSQDYQQKLQASQADGSAAGFNQFNHQFDANDLQANLNPNYDFMLQQGQGQAKNLANSTGGLLSGNALQGLNTFTQNYAKNAYQDAFNNYNTNQTNIYNRLASIAGLGQTSLQNSAASGMNATNAASNYLTSGAAAQAAGTVGSANAVSGTLGSLATAAGAYYGAQK